MLLKKNYVLFFALLFVIAQAGCGSSGTETSTSTSDTSAVSSAVGAAFSSSGSSSISTPIARAFKKAMKLFIQDARALTDECATMESGPASVTTSFQGSTDEFGRDGNKVSLDEDTDYCQDGSGSDNTGSGLYISFTMSGGTVNCTDVPCTPGDDDPDCDETTETKDISFTMSGSGVAVQNEYFPAVFGTFTISGDDVENGTVDCSIYLDEDENVVAPDGVESGCTNSTGDEVDQPGITCTIPG